MKRNVVFLLILALLISLVPLGVGLADDAVDVPTIEVYVPGPWVASPLPPAGEDIYQNFFNETFGANFVLTFSTEGGAEMMTRFAANNPPDLLPLSNGDLNMLYDQGLLLADWTPYLDAMPLTTVNMGDLGRKFFTRNDNLICIPAMPGEQAFSFMIRKDWLEALDLAMPTTTAELLEVLKAFTFNDPDGNGQDDTFGITSAGGGKGVGELSSMLLFFGGPNFYIGEDGEVTHPILAGYYKDYLDFFKEIIDAKVIDPDWYTQGWEERKPALFSNTGKYGVCWYPPAALVEEMQSFRHDDAVVDWWGVMGMLEGAQPAWPIYGTIRTVSAAAGEDAAKMEKIVAFLEGLAVPNEAYYSARHGVGIDNMNMKDFNGMKYLHYDPNDFIQKSSQEGAYLATAVWGQPINVPAPFDGVFFGITPEPERATLGAMEMTKQVLDAPTWPAEYRMLNPDPTINEEVNTLVNEFAINYIIGKETDYEQFVETWKYSGGEDLLESAIATFKDYGLIP